MAEASGVVELEDEVLQFIERSEAACQHRGEDKDPKNTTVKISSIYRHRDRSHNPTVRMRARGNNSLDMNFYYCNLCLHH
jgi:hypothetical protein